MVFYVGDSMVSAPLKAVSDGASHTAYLEKQRDRISLKVDDMPEAAEGAPGIVDQNILAKNDLFMGTWYIVR